MALMERVSEAQRHAKMVRYGETVCKREEGHAASDTIHVRVLL